MFLVLRNIVFDLIFLVSMNSPVIQSSCGTNSHNCSDHGSTRLNEVYLLQNGIDRATIDFEQPDTGAQYAWTLGPFNGSNPYQIDLAGQDYNSSGDKFSLIPTVGSQGLYSCRTTTNTQQQCPRDYCVRLMSSPMIAMFYATYFVETTYTVFSLEVTYDNNDDVTTCLPVNIITLSDGTTNLATCFGVGFDTCFGPDVDERNVTKSFNMSIGSGFKYNLTVSNPPYTDTNDAFTFFVTVRTSVNNPSPSTSTRLIISTQTYSASAMLTVISPATTTPVEMTSFISPMMSSSSLPLEPGMSSMEMSFSSTTSSSSVAPSSTTTSEPSRTTAQIIITIVVPSVISVSVLLVILVIVFLSLMCLYPRIMNKRSHYNLNDGDNNTINTNGVTEPAFELPAQGFSKEGNI